jgi:hypothetical protein
MTARHTETLIIGAGQMGHDDRQAGVLNAGKVPVKRNRFVKLSGGDKSVNRELEATVRGLAGLKAYITNIDNPSPEFVIGAHHQLWRIEKSCRMSKDEGFGGGVRVAG